MFKSQTSVRVAYPEPPMPCPKCGKDLRLAYIVPGRAGPDIRTLKCLDCGYSDTASVPA